MPMKLSMRGGPLMQGPPLKLAGSRSCCRCKERTVGSGQSFNSGQDIQKSRETLERAYGGIYGRSYV